MHRARSVKMRTNVAKNVQSRPDTFHMTHEQRTAHRSDVRDIVHDTSWRLVCDQDVNVVRNRLPYVVLVRIHERLSTCISHCMPCRLKISAALTQSKNSVE